MGGLGGWGRWKPFNTSETLPRAAPGWWGRRGFGHTLEAFKHDKNTGKGGHAGGGGGGGAVGGGGGEGRGGLGTHWKPLNTSKTLARARLVESVGGWRGGGGGGEGWAHIGSL